MPPVIVVMGVSGCGKTTVASQLARLLGGEFVEGDAFHPIANVEKMRAGIALADADRHDWLLALAQRMRQAREQNQALALSCSALKRSYRDVLRAAVPDLQLVHLVADFDVIAQRMAQRPGHYMPASLLQSQFAALEAPDTDENAWVMSATQTASDIVQLLGQRLQSSTSETHP